MSTPSGWYPDPTSPGARRWWDGSEWTAHAAVAERKRSSFGLALTIAAGILIALVIAFAVYRMAHVNDGLKCETENGQRALDGEQAQDCG